MDLWIGDFTLNIPAHLFSKQSAENVHEFVLLSFSDHSYVTVGRNTT